MITRKGERFGVGIRRDDNATGFFPDEKELAWRGEGGSAVY